MHKNKNYKKLLTKDKYVSVNMLGYYYLELSTLSLKMFDAY